MTSHAIGTNAVLTHMAVEPTARNAGVGQALVAAFVGVAGEHGTPQLRLVTRDDPSGVAGFYERLGWSRGPSAVDVDGQQWVTYTLDLA